jgi:hypothetical protein
MKFCSWLEYFFLRVRVRCHPVELFVGTSKRLFRMSFRASGDRGPTKVMTTWLFRLSDSAGQLWTTWRAPLRNMSMQPRVNYMTWRPLMITRYLSPAASQRCDSGPTFTPQRHGEASHYTKNALSEIPGFLILNNSGEKQRCHPPYVRILKSTQLSNNRSRVLTLWLNINIMHSVISNTKPFVATEISRASRFTNSYETH